MFRPQQDVRTALFLQLVCYDPLATILWKVTTNQMDWTPGKEEGNQFLPTMFLPPSPGALAFCEVQTCRGCSSWYSTRLTLCIKAPEEHSHSHHEQGIEVDYLGPAWVLTDIV